MKIKDCIVLDKTVLEEIADENGFIYKERLLKESKALEPIVSDAFETGRRYENEFTFDVDERYAPNKQEYLNKEI